MNCKQQSQFHYTTLTSESGLLLTLLQTQEMSKEYLSIAGDNEQLLNPIYVARIKI